MLSGLTLPARSYPAVGRATQLAHQRCSPLGPLVLELTPRTLPAPTTDRDRTVSRRSEPSSRAALMGEQPNPWDRLQPQDATSRHRTFSAVTSSADYLFTLPYPARGRRVVAAINLRIARTATVAKRPQSVRGQFLTRNDFPRRCPPRVRVV